ncbi:MAG: hypothetical protein JWO63_1219 [Frankiales bacterium]|nr:hypothetical protein [Frankiales bacterium]
MTSPTISSKIVLEQGDLAVVPVPEGRVVLRNEQTHVSARVESVILLFPHGSGEPQELARYSHNSHDASGMLTLALAALDSWK